MSWVMATSSISVSMFDFKANIFGITFFLLLSLSSLTLSGQETTSGEDILLSVQKYGQAEVVIAYPGFEAMSNIAGDFSVSSCDGKTAVLCLSAQTAPLFVKKGISYSLIKREDKKSVIMASSVTEAMQWDTYPTYTQYDSIVHALAAQYPDRCLLDTVGYSINGKTIFALKISDNVNADEGEPEVFLTSSIHGDELCGFVLMLRLAEMLVTRSSEDELVNMITSGTEVWINPLSNPDGMYRSGDVIVSPIRFNSNNIDLNRNYPDPEITNGVTIQPENSAMISFMKKHHFSLSVNFHSGAEVVNYPWDRWTRLHSDNDWFFDISRRYVDTVHLYSSAGYMDDQYYGQYPGVTNGATWYVINGGRQDFVTYNLEGREVTIELDVNKMTDAGQLESMWNYNNRSILYFIKEVLSGIHGRVTDASSGDPVDALIFIQGHDEDFSEVTTDETGNYIRLLSPGTWTVTFLADGYEAYVAENTSVYGGEITYLNVVMNKKVSINDEVVISPVPSTGGLKILLPDSMSGKVSFTVTNVSGMLVDTFTDQCYQGVPVDHDFSDLSSGLYFINARNISNGKIITGKIIIITDRQ